MDARCGCVCVSGEGDVCRKRLLHCATLLLLAEMKRTNGAGIQGSYVAMETTAKRERETDTHTNTHTEMY